jgi:uncharacterized protein
MRILAISDIELSFIYSPVITHRFQDADLVISCGDLPYYYLEYIISMLNIPLYFVNGNHMNRVEVGEAGDHYYPWGAIPLNQRSVRHPSGMLISGIDGSLQYNFGPYQYSQSQMWSKVFSLIPTLFINHIRFGRFIDIFVTHAPPWKIHDKEDRPHQGIKAFRWFDKVFRPQMHLHGHIHVYRQDTLTETQLNLTRVINAYGFRELILQIPGQNEIKDNNGVQMITKE